MSRCLHVSWVALLALLLAGCGSGAAGGGADADPASVVPASAKLYLEGPVKPEGAQREGLLAAAGKVLRTQDPERRLRELLDRASAEGRRELDYERDVEPWAGRRAGMFFEGLEADEPSALLVVSAADPDKAQDAIDAWLEREPGPTREAEHAGVDYRVMSKDDAAVGMIGDFVAIGDEPQLRKAIDASQGDSLAESKAYRETVGELADERIGTAFVDAKALFAQALREDPEARRQLEQLDGLFELDKLAPIGMALLADGDRIALDTVASSAGAGALVDQLSLLSGNGTTPLLGEVPADSWLALGAPEVGRSAQTIFDGVAGALGGAAIAAQVERQTGLELREDVFSWIGDVALFVRGVDEATFDGAVVIEATDPAKARTAITKLVGVATQRAPQTRPRPVSIPGAETAFSLATDDAKPAIVAIGGDRVVAAYGRDAAREALDPEAELADAATFKDARADLGGDAEPAAFVSMPALVDVLQRSGDVAGDPGWAKVKPYLEALSAVVSGGERDGDRQRSRLAVGLK